MPDNPAMGGASPPAIGAWLIVLLGAFASGVETGLMATIGYLSQWALKAPKNVSNWLAPTVTAVVCLGAYAVLHRPSWPIGEDWIRAWAVWSLAAMGVGSVAGHTGGAAATNTL